MIGALNGSSVRTFATVAFAVCGFLGLIIWGEYSSWRSQVVRIEAELVQTSKALVQHADDTIDMSKFPLSALMTQIEQERADPNLAVKIAATMKRQVDTTSWLDTLSVMSADGRIVATSSQVQTQNLSFADRDYFKFHKSSITRQPVLSKPVKSRISGEWILPITQRISNLDGSFGGIAFASITVADFVKFFEAFRIGNEGSFQLIRSDGIILARQPFVESLMATDVSGYDLFKVHLAHGEEGSYHYISPVDGTQRIGGFYRSQHSGLVGLAAASQSEALSAWMRGAHQRWLSGIVVVTITGMLAWRWRRQVLLRRAGEALLVAREAEFRLLAEGSSDLIQRFNGLGVREYLSPSSKEIFGIDAEHMIGTSILDNLHEDDREGVIQMMNRLRSGSLRENMIVRRKRADGKQIWLETTLNRLPGAIAEIKDIRLVAVTRDVTRQKKLQEELDQLANTDELTQLANRRSFNIHFDEMVERATMQKLPLSLLMIDADRFKFFNDTYGHAAGDDCLKALAQVALGSIRRAKDLAARYGGEEIAILLPDTDVTGAERVAQTIRQRVANLKLPHEKNIPWGYVTISIGTATLHSDEAGLLTASELFDRADHALYQAKNAGRNQVLAAEDEGVIAAMITGSRSA
ncbi:diguanylate cyclase [Rhizobium sp. XQZ8]|uniref:sensor domain-containing diguanylate cyclase n=1 Tax=Rhizobium populisoli TaxID=2859785 RepID=UPI001CA48F60|nr:diguanylate cyclase [Rhizobium populisoli]MBW6420812.1 diguanylate cyclase [Rhizobium populisoli]